MHVFHINVLHLLELHMVFFSPFSSICMMGLCGALVLFLIPLLCASFLLLFNKAFSFTLLDNSPLILYAFVLAPT